MLKQKNQEAKEHENRGRGPELSFFHFSFQSSRTRAGGTLGDLDLHPTIPLSYLHVFFLSSLAEGSGPPTPPLP